MYSYIYIYIYTYINILFILYIYIYIYKAPLKNSKCPCLSQYLCQFLSHRDSRVVHYFFSDLVAFVARCRHRRGLSERKRWI